MTSKFSGKTIACFARALGDVVYNHTAFDLLFIEYGVQEFDAGGNTQARALRLIQGIGEKNETEEADRLLSELMKSPLSRTPHNNPSVQPLISSLEVDGFEYREDHLIPTTPAPAALAPQISGHERDLEEFGFDVAATHYRQAADNFADGNLEACNGQIRSYMEDLMIQICERQTGNRFGDPTATLQHLRVTGMLDPDEWNLARAFWNSIQDNGPHHGLTHAEEARFRLHVSTALGRYLIDRLIRQPGGDP